MKFLIVKINKIDYFLVNDPVHEVTDGSAQNQRQPYSHHPSVVGGLVKKN